MEKRKKIIIVGAGIAGLATGCYAEMNGYETVIYEMAGKPGGVCTSWSRHGFTFDYCMHNLIGTGSKSSVRKIWNELGAFSDGDIIDHEVFVRVEGSAGEVLNLYTDLRRLQKHLLDIASEDKEVIREYIKGARSIARADVFSLPLGEKKSWIGMLGHLPALNKWGKVTMGSFADRFSSPFLRRAFRHVQYDIDEYDMPIMPNIAFMGGQDAGDLGWVRGGSRQFSNRIAGRYADLGGTLHCNSPVDRIIVREGCACGVRLADGTDVPADIVVSAADGYKTIYKMLEGKYTNDLIDRYYEQFPESQPFGLQVYFGLNRELPEVPHALVLLFDRPLTIEGEEKDSLYIKFFNSQSGLVSEGKSVVQVITGGNYSYWNNLYQNPAKYKEAKKKTAGIVLDALEKRFPGIREQVEVVDVSIPSTVERYTNNFHGWLPWTPKTEAAAIMRQGLSKTLPGLDNFYMAGQWAGATIGISSAAIMGRNLVRDLCQKDGRKFVTST